MAPIELRDRIDDLLLSLPDEHLMAKLQGYASAEREKKLSATGKVGVPRVSKGAIPEVQTIQFQGHRIAYLTLTESSSRHEHFWSGLLKDLREVLPSSETFIFDLRGNGGGEDTGGIAIAEMLYGRKVPYPVVKQYQRQNPAALAIAANYSKLFSLKLKSMGRGVPAGLERSYEDEYALYIKSKRSNQPVTVERTDHRIIERIGIKPAIKVPEGKDAYDYVLESFYPPAKQEREKLPARTFPKSKLKSQLLFRQQLTPVHDK
jgi:hypothetical protein